MPYTRTALRWGLKLSAGEFETRPPENFKLCKPYRAVPGDALIALERETVVHGKKRRRPRRTKNASGRDRVHESQKVQSLPQVPPVAEETRPWYRCSWAREVAILVFRVALEVFRAQR